MRPVVHRATGAALTSAAVSWYFMRVSGVLMMFLALGHLFIMHYLKAPAETDAAFVAGRWANLLWTSFDWMLLVMALAHGLLGLHSVIKDYVHGAGWRLLVGTVIAVMAMVFFTVGSVTILSFRPDRLPDRAGPLSGQTWIGDVMFGLLVLLATATYGGTVATAFYAGRRLALGLPAGRWAFPGQWAWALHRLTGVGIVGFLLIHILDVMLLPLAPDVYDLTVKHYASPYLIPMEIALVAAVLYHALNGARIIAMEVWDSAARTLQAKLFFAVVALTIVLLLPSIPMLLKVQ